MADRLIRIILSNPNTDELKNSKVLQIFKQFFEVDRSISFETLKEQIFDVLIGKRGDISQFDLYHIDGIKYTDTSQFRDGDTVYLKRVENFNSEVSSVLDKWGLGVETILIHESKTSPDILIDNKNLIWAGGTFTDPVFQYQRICYFDTVEYYKISIRKTDEDIPSTSLEGSKEATKAYPRFQVQLFSYKRDGTWSCEWTKYFKPQVTN